ncbi:MAG: hypothetical protein EPO35_09180 [Acidobacteria bacterium]|nr:MAG: hypothetical protein EPO35_09180 [Acidobacteriota bacterium]
MRVRLLLVLGMSLIALGVCVNAQAPGSKRDSEKMQESLGAILTRAASGAVKGKPKAPLRTTFTDAQLNAWLLADGKGNVPVGLLSPTVTFLAGGKVTAKAVVDLDAVRKSKPRSMLDPMNWLSGLIPVTLTGTLSGNGGMGTFDVETWSLGSVTLPRSVLQELISYYSKSPDYPDGITLGKPFPLPAEVRELIIARGTATVVQ